MTLTIIKRPLKSTKCKESWFVATQLRDDIFPTTASSFQFSQILQRRSKTNDKYSKFHCSVTNLSSFYHSPFSFNNINYFESNGARQLLNFCSLIETTIRKIKSVWSSFDRSFSNFFWAFYFHGWRQRGWGEFYRRVCPQRQYWL